MARARGAQAAFAARSGKRYTKSAFNEHVWYPALEAVGLKGELPFHDLRHTAISLQARAGIPAEVIAERVGHSDGGALIRKRYRHLYPGEAAAHLGKLDALIHESRSPAMDVSGTQAT